MDDQRRYLVTRVVPGYTFAEPEFRPGAELVYWNGMAVERAIRADADQTAGSNEVARHARSVNALTLRPMNTALRLTRISSTWNSCPQEPMRTTRTRDDRCGSTGSFVTLLPSGAWRRRRRSDDEPEREAAPRRRRPPGHHVRRSQLLRSAP